MRKSQQLRLNDQQYTSEYFNKLNSSLTEHFTVEVELDVDMTTGTSHVLIDMARTHCRWGDDGFAAQSAILRLEGLTP